MSQRFTDAELAAEYWHQLYVAENLFTHRKEYPNLWTHAQRRAALIRRFATLPHAHNNRADTQE